MKNLLSTCLVLAVFAVAVPALAAEDENILVIEVAGANPGVIEIELLPELAPNHVARIRELASSGAYDDVVFHRVIEGFMAQTGDVEFGKRELFGKGQAGMGGSTLPDLKQEFSDEPHVEGIVSMARSQNPDSANSQFFIVFDDATFLDGQYTVFGRVISGMDVVHKIKKGTGQNGAVSDPDYMKSVTMKSDSR